MNKWYFTEIKCSTQIWRSRPEVYLPEWKGRGRHPTRLRLRNPADHPTSVNQLVALLPEYAWSRATIKEGSKGPIVCDFAFLRVIESRANLPGPEIWLAPTNQRRESVLLLVDQASAGQPLQQHLRRKGFAVEVVDISQQADWLEQVTARPPGAVVLDFQPGAERGWEVMQLIKHHPGASDVPVIFYSVSSDRSTGSVLEMDYLSKPVGSVELAQALERLGLRNNLQRPTILVVDDDPHVLEMHARMLESQVSCRILKANSGVKALELLQKQRLSLVLLDLRMPGMDGFEVLQRMRSQANTRNVPVIVLSAQVLTAGDMRRLQEGVAAVLGKGLFSMEEVLQQVEAALSHSKRLGSPASRIVRQAMAYIHEHYSEPVTRSELAQHVAVSEHHLTLCFRQEMGITPLAYLNRYRIRQAKELLERRSYTINAVAQMVGFTDSSYFGRVFRQETGASPSDYLKH